MTARDVSRIAAVRTILAAQRSALRKGDYAALSRLSDRLITALSGLDASGNSPALAQLRQEAGHTARLLRAAQAGLARARSDTATARATALTTYDARGRRTDSYPADGRTLARG